MTIPRRILLPPHEHDDDTVSPFRPSHVHEPSSYVCASRRSRPRPYVHIRGRIFWHVAVCTCTRFRRDNLNCYVGSSTMTCAATYSATVHRCRATYRPVCTYTFATRQTTLRTLRPGGSQLSGRIRTHFLACEDISVGSQLSGGENIFSSLIRMNFPCVRPWTSWVPAVRLSTYSPLPMTLVC